MLKDLPLALQQLWHPRNRRPVLAVSSAMILLIAVADVRTDPSLAFLYLIPIALSAAFLPRWSIVLLGLACAGLAEAFGHEPTSYSGVRITLAAIGFAACGLSTGELIRARRRLEAALTALIETSGSAIVTVNERGAIELANRAAADLMVPQGGRLIGSPIAAFLPSLHNALQRGEAPGLRTSMQCVGHRSNGEVFTAIASFSTCRVGATSMLAAIVTPVSEEALAPSGSSPSISGAELGEGRSSLSLNGREVEVMRLVVQGLANKEIAAKMAVSESTIKHTLQQLFSKTGVRTRGQLVRVSLDHHRDLL